MKWKQVDKWHLESSPAGYTISKSGIEPDVAYQAWAGRELLWTQRGADAVGRCKAACAAHKESTPAL